MKTKLAIGLLIFSLAGISCFADTFTHQTAGMSIWFPDNWKITTEGDMLEAIAPADDAYIQLMALEDVKTMEQAVDIYTEEIDKIVKNFKPISEGENIEINGLNVFYIDGEGYVEKVLMDISLSIIVTRKAMVMVIGFSERASTEKYEKVFENIISSMKAV